MVQVETQKFPNPDARPCCPICGGVDCPLFIGVYYRQQVVINFNIYQHFPGMRFLCRDKGSLNSKHKTFSLYPKP
ncbi:hypothetical protein L0128_02720 [candidate division KSB1 bacterium]|nr:hypothetical protein [candidate division KSB1 bacterium]